MEVRGHPNMLCDQDFVRSRPWVRLAPVEHVLEEQLSPRSGCVFEDVLRDLTSRWM